MNFDRNEQFKKDYSEIFFKNPCPLYLELVNKKDDYLEFIMCDRIYWRAMNNVTNKNNTSKGCHSLK